MAARSHVDPAVNERRLRPIYDCLDNGNNKKAAQEAEKLLKKQRDFQCAKVLKALALIRLGKQDEGASILQEVHKEFPNEDSTLQAMTICYRELHKPSLIADAYENAVKKDPANEELYSHLFMAYVRLGDYKKQQQTAMALYKIKPKNPYYFWAVMSLVMQACNSEKELATNMFLPLAQKMVEKFINENKIDAEAEIQLYLLILEKQGKFEDCLNVLTGPLSEKLPQYLDNIPRRKAEYLIKLERWPEVNSAYKSLLLNTPDNWQYFLQYFKSIDELISSNWQPEKDSESLDPPVDYTFEMAAIFVESLHSKQNDEEFNHRVLRAPYLAQMEIAYRLEKANKSIESLSEEKLLFSFYERYGSKASCYLDMSFIISSHSIREDELEKLLADIKAFLQPVTNDSQITYPDNLKLMQYHLSYCQLCYSVGCYDKLPKQDKFNLINELIERYRHGLSFGANLGPTEFQPSDDYCLLAANVLLDIWQESGNENLLWQLIVMLEEAILTSPSNYQFKLLLLKLYNCLGAAGVSYALWESVDMKHIQQETLGYLITNPLISAGHFTNASTVLGNAVWFFTGNFKDMVEYLIACYKFGSFTKIQEMVDFREKLSCSMQYSAVTLDRLILDLCLETKNKSSTDSIIDFMEIDPEKDKTVWKDLVDNRDVDVFRVWSDTKKGVIREIKCRTFEEEVMWLKLRNVLVRSVGAAFKLTKEASHHQNNFITNGEKRSMSDVLLELITSLREHLATIDLNSLRQSNFPLQAPTGNRLKSYIDGGHCNVFISLLGLILQFYTKTEFSDGADQCDSQIKYVITECFQNMFKRIDELVSSNPQSICKMKLINQELVNCVETLSLTTVLLHIAHTILKPAKSAAGKKGKKKKEGTVESEDKVTTFQYFVDLVTEMEKCVKQFQDKINYVSVSILTTQLENISLDNDKRGEVIEKVKERLHASYKQSLKELSDLAQMKLKFLQILKN